MLLNKPKPKRFIGLDLHKYYLVAIGVDEDANKVYGPKRVNLVDLEAWIQKTITPDDALVVETTANAFQVYDALLPYAHSVTVVHPPHVALVVHSQVRPTRSRRSNWRVCWPRDCWRASGYRHKKCATCARWLVSAGK